MGSRALSCAGAGERVAALAPSLTPRDPHSPRDKDAAQRSASVEREREERKKERRKEKKEKKELKKQEDKKQDELASMVSSLREQLTAMEAAVECANLLMELSKQERSDEMQRENTCNSQDSVSLAEHAELLQKYQALQKSCDANREENKSKTVSDSEAGDLTPRKNDGEASFETPKKNKIINDLREQSSRLSNENEKLRSEKKALEARVKELVQTTARLSRLKEIPSSQSCSRESTLVS